MQALAKRAAVTLFGFEGAVPLAQLVEHLQNPSDLQRMSQSLPPSAKPRLMDKESGAPD